MPFCRWGESFVLGEIGKEDAAGASFRGREGSRRTGSALKYEMTGDWFYTELYRVSLCSRVIIVCPSLSIRFRLFWFRDAALKAWFGSI